jgi:hypothetical protein
MTPALAARARKASEQAAENAPGESENYADLAALIGARVLERDKIGREPASLRRFQEASS